MEFCQTPKARGECDGANNRAGGSDISQGCACMCMHLRVHMYSACLRDRSAHPPCLHSMTDHSCKNGCAEMRKSLVECLAKQPFSFRRLSFRNYPRVKWCENNHSSPQTRRRRQETLGFRLRCRRQTMCPQRRRLPRGLCSNRSRPRWRSPYRNG